MNALDGRGTQDQQDRVIDKVAIHGRLTTASIRKDCILIECLDFSKWMIMPNGRSYALHPGYSIHTQEEETVRHPWDCTCNDCLDWI